MSKYTVIRDTREQAGQGWLWSPSAYCEGTIVKTLKTADYTMLGFEALLAIERKRNTSEFSQNIVQDRFEKELIRLEAFPMSFLVLEFTMNDIMNFPKNSGVPAYMHKKIKINPKFILKRLNYFQIKYKTKIILAGNYGKEVVSDIFNQVNQEFGNAAN